MNKESLSRLRKPLRILLSASIILAALCLMGACVYICHYSRQPFSRESVSAVFRFIALPVYLCLGLTLLSFLAEHLLPRAEEIQPPVRQLRMVLKRMQQRTELSLCHKELRKEILALRSDRKLYRNISRTVLVLSSILFLTYGLNDRNFHPVHINQSMLRAMFWLLPCTAVPFVVCLFVDRKDRISMAKEIELLKSAPKESRIVPPRYLTFQRREFLLRTALLAIGFVMLLLGCLSGGTADVLTKAANICTECIGLG